MSAGINEREWYVKRYYHALAREAANDPEVQPLLKRLDTETTAKFGSFGSTQIRAEARQQLN